LSDALLQEERLDASALLDERWDAPGSRDEPWAAPEHGSLEVSRALDVPERAGLEQVSPPVSLDEPEQRSLPERGRAR
jgi:hypothetical protein